MGLISDPLPKTPKKELQNMEYLKLHKKYAQATIDLHKALKDKLSNQ